MAKESRFAEVYRQQLMKDKGILGAFASTASERGKEMVDLRRLLPKSGITGAISQRIFGRAYRSGAARDSVESTKISRVDMNSQVTARNTSVLPAMAREMNLTRLNMQKLVKLAGGTPSRTSTLKDTSVKKESSSVIGKTVGGIGSAAGGILGGLFSALGGLGSGLISIGGSLLSGVVGLLGSAGGAIFRVIGGGLSALGPLGILLSAGAGFLIYRLSESIDFDKLGSDFKKMYNDITSSIKSFFGIDESGKSTSIFGTGLFADQINYTKKIYDDWLSEGKRLADIGIATFEYMGEKIEELVIAVVAGLGISAIANTGLDYMGRGRRRGFGAGAPRSLPSSSPKTAALLRAPVAAGAAGGLSSLGRGALAAGKVVAALGLRIGLYTLGGPLGWILAGISVYQVIQAFNQIDTSDIDEMVAENILTKEEADFIKEALKQRPDINIPKVQSEIDHLERKINSEGGNVVTQNRLDAARTQLQKLQTIEHNAQTAFSGVNVTANSNASKVRFDAKVKAANEANEARKTQNQKRYEDSKTPTKIRRSNEEYRSLAERISKTESGGNYEALNPNTTLPGATKMTIAEVVAKAKGKAVGKYQNMPEFLIQRARDSGLDPNKDLYSPENQELIQENLLRENLRILEKAGITATDENLYWAHRIGAGGVIQAMNVWKNSPSKSLAEIFPKYASQNPDLKNVSSSNFVASGTGMLDNRRLTSTPAKSITASTPNSDEVTLKDMLAAIPEIFDILAKSIQQTNKNMESVVEALKTSTVQQQNQVSSVNPYFPEVTLEHMALATTRT